MLNIVVTGFGGINKLSYVFSYQSKSASFSTLSLVCSSVLHIQYNMLQDVNYNAV